MTWRQLDIIFNSFPSGFVECYNYNVDQSCDLNNFNKIKKSIWGLKIWKIYPIIFVVKVLVYDLIKLFFHEIRKGTGNMVSLGSNHFS